MNKTLDNVMGFDLRNMPNGWTYIWDENSIKAGSFLFKLSELINTNGERIANHYAFELFKELQKFLSGRAITKGTSNMRREISAALERVEREAGIKTAFDVRPSQETEGKGHERTHVVTVPGEPMAVICHGSRYVSVIGQPSVHSCKALAAFMYYLGWPDEREYNRAEFENKKRFLMEEIKGAMSHAGGCSCRVEEEWPNVLLRWDSGLWLRLHVEDRSIAVGGCVASLEVLSQAAAIVTNLQKRGWDKDTIPF